MILVFMLLFGLYCFFCFLRGDTTMFFQPFPVPRKSICQIQLHLKVKEKPKNIAFLQQIRTERTVWKPGKGCRTNCFTTFLVAPYSGFLPSRKRDQVGFFIAWLVKGDYVFVKRDYRKCKWIFCFTFHPANLKKGQSCLHQERHWLQKNHRFNCLCIVSY